jgi:DNA-binding transcriptional LysR family regulator
VTRAADECYRLSSGQHGTLNIGIFGSSTFDLVPEVIKRLSKALPEVRISLHMMNKDMQVQALREQRLTAAFNRLVPDEPDIRQEFVRSERLLVALSDKHQLASKAPVSLRDIVKEPLILYPRGVRDGLIVNVLKLFEAQKLAPNVIQEVADAPTAIALVASGMGLTIAPEAVANLGMAGVIYLPIAGDPPPSVELVCLYRRDDRSPILARFLEAVRDARDSLERS